MSGTPKQLITLRSPLRSHTTRLCNEITAKYDNLTLREAHSYVAQLEAINLELHSLDDQLVVLYTKNEDDTQYDVLEAEVEKSLEYELKIRKHLAELKCKISSLNITTASASNNSGNQSNNNATIVSGLNASMKFQEVPLPSYAGKETESYDDFIANFEAIAAQSNARNFEKFLLLKKCLKGEAEKVISGIGIADDSYDNAKNFLKKAFADGTKQKFALLEKMIE